MKYIYAFASMLLHFFSKALILSDLLLEVTFKDFKVLRSFCKSVVSVCPKKMLFGITSIMSKIKHISNNTCI